MEDGGKCKCCLKRGWTLNGWKWPEEAKFPALSKEKLPFINLQINICNFKGACTSFVIKSLCGKLIANEYQAISGFHQKTGWDIKYSVKEKSKISG